MDEIKNRVAESALIVFDLEELYPQGRRVFLDIKDWLYEGLILREKDFREQVATHDWEQYQDAYVALGCSTDAIVPGWAYMLLTTALGGIPKKVVIGDLEALESALYQAVLEGLDVTAYTNKPVIIKGCSRRPVPKNAYIWALQKLQAVAKSIMYGEACSAVPLFKRKKS